MITVQFKDFEEMRTFAKELLGINAGRAEEIGAPEGQTDQTPMQMQPAVPAVTEPAAGPGASGIPAEPDNPGAPAGPDASAHTAFSGTGRTAAAGIGANHYDRLYAG